MSARYTTVQHGDVTVIDAVGRITLGEGSSDLRDILGQLVRQGHTKIVLNVGDVQYMDSSGVGEMVSGSRLVRNHGGDIVLVALTKRVKDLLQITKLYADFTIYEEGQEAEAIRSFSVCPTCKRPL